MSAIDLASVEALLKFRYATKKFDPSKLIPAETWKVLEQALVLSPSSFGLQLWKFVVVTNPDVKKQLVAASWGQGQVGDASHVVVFCAKTETTMGDVDKLIARTSEVRGVPVAALQGYSDLIKGFISKPPPWFDAKSWTAKQAYIALGEFMTAAAALGVDTCPMEGIAPPEYSKILGLEGSGYEPVVACPTGYRAADDKTANAPKVRYAASEVVKYV